MTTCANGVQRPQGRDGGAERRGAWISTRTSSSAVVGPSGCGKSTLLNIIAGLTEADQRHGAAATARGRRRRGTRARRGVPAVRAVPMADGGERTSCSRWRCAA
ncbi:MAG: ATP-binding cassette domain-containing protein [Ruthenibacterium lactatiformans]